jgi:hypothetical protein
LFEPSGKDTDVGERTLCSVLNCPCGGGLEASMAVLHALPRDLDLGNLAVPESDVKGLNEPFDRSR